MYTFEKTDTKQQLLEVNQGDVGNGSVDTWKEAFDQGQVVANEQWTYKFLGHHQQGQLENNLTHQCLQVNGTSGAIDQWPCTEQDNHLWQIVRRPDGEIALRIDLPTVPGWDAGTYYLATTVASADATNGTALTLVNDISDERTQWIADRQDGN